MQNMRNSTSLYGKPIPTESLPLFERLVAENNRLNEELAALPEHNDIMIIPHRISVGERKQRIEARIRLLNKAMKAILDGKVMFVPPEDRPPLPEGAAHDPFCLSQQRSSNI